MGAVRHFLRVDPESLERKNMNNGFWELTWEATRQIHAFHKLGMFCQAVRLDKESVPLDRLGS